MTHKQPITFDRRKLVAGAAGAALAAGTTLRLTRAQSATPAVSATPAATTCTLTPELTEGPYYVANELVRQDITEGKTGVPLALRIAVRDTAGCTPLANAAVDIWHCDALGYYSGITGENPGGGGTSQTGSDNATTTFLRGIQLTDAQGAATFQTIYPGWYTGRTVHIHVKVHVGGTESGASTSEHYTAATSPTPASSSSTTQPATRSSPSSPTRSTPAHARATTRTTSSAITAAIPASSSA